MHYTRTTRQAVVFSKQRRWSQPILGTRWLKLKLAFLVFRKLEHLGLSWGYTFRPNELSSGAGAGGLPGQDVRPRSLTRSGVRPFGRLNRVSAASKIRRLNKELRSIETLAEPNVEQSCTSTI